MEQAAASGMGILCSEWSGIEKYRWERREGAGESKHACCNKQPLLSASKLDVPDSPTNGRSAGSHLQQ